MKNGKSEIVVVLDRSGSMSYTKKDAEGGLREFIAKQRVLPGECSLTFYRFDDLIDRVFEDKPLSDVKDEDLVLEPRGTTALLDAMSQAIDEVGARLARRADYDRPEFVYFVTITDGQENASRTHRTAVFGKVTHQREKYKWQFIFIGADQDAIATAASLGIGADSSLSYRGSRVSTGAVYQVLNCALATSRSTGQVASFNDSQRQSVLTDDNPLAVKATHRGVLHGTGGK